MKDLNVLVVGCGNMGTSHGRAYWNLAGFNLVGLVSRGARSREKLSKELGGVPTFDSFDEALAQTQPDVVSINSYPDTHADYVRKSLNMEAHVFVEKPLSETVHEADELVALANAKNKKLVIGYILRVHPAWALFVEKAHTLGKPLVMRMNLNQQSSGAQWETHKQLMKSVSPIVDCGVHYLDMMCLMTKAAPVLVNAVGARLTEDVDKEMYNYAQLQVVFDDDSVGWYEAGWGPMMSETAFFVKDVIGPKGSVSIVDSNKGESQDIDGHTQTGGLKVHYSELDSSGEFSKKDEFIDTAGESDHDELCCLEQQFLLRAIREDLDLSEHMRDAVNSLRVVLAADKALRTRSTVYL